MAQAQTYPDASGEAPRRCRRLAMLGTGIGASTVDPLQAGESPSASAFGIGAAHWWGISSLVALFAGGWVAVTATGAAAVAPKIADAAGDQMSKAGVSFESLKREAQQVLAQTGKPALQPGAMAQQAGGAAADVQQTAGTSAAGDQAFSSLFDRLMTRGREATSQVDRDALIHVVVARTGLSRDEAAQRVAGWENTAEQARAKATQVTDQAKQKAREAGDATAKGISQGMLLGFVALALGALAAWWGGSMGQRRGIAL